MSPSKHHFWSAADRGLNGLVLLLGVAQSAELRRPAPSHIGALGPFDAMCVGGVGESGMASAGPPGWGQRKLKQPKRACARDAGYSAVCELMKFPAWSLLRLIDACRAASLHEDCMGRMCGLLEANAQALDHVHPCAQAATCTT